MASNSSRSMDDVTDGFMDHGHSSHDRNVLHNLQEYLTAANNGLALCSELEKDWKVNIPRPKVIVVGGESSGKSTLLESLAGVEVLPKGSGTVTKCPIEIRFHRSAKLQLVVGNQTFKSGPEAEREIRSYFQRIEKEMQGLSDSTLVVEVYSSTAPEMILIDTPGLIAVAERHEDPNLPSRVKQLARKFIQDPDSIILVVQPAIEDIKKAVAIKLAQEENVDPSGSRTIAVLTMLDKIKSDEDKANLHNYLKIGRGIVNLGVIGVANRTGLQSFPEAKRNEDKAIESIFTDEKERSRHGLNYLGERISGLILYKIHESLHSITLCLEESYLAEVNTLNKLGKGGVGDKGKALLLTVNLFAKDFSRQLDGSNRQVSVEEKSGSYWIRKFYTEDFKDEMKLHSLDNLKYKSFVNVILNARGHQGHTFLTEVAFERVAQKIITDLLAPCEKLVDKVFDIVAHTIPTQCYPFKEGNNCFPLLQEKILAKLETFLQAPKAKTLELIHEYIEMQRNSPCSYEKGFVAKWLCPENKPYLAITEADTEELIAAAENLDLEGMCTKKSKKNKLPGASGNAILTFLHQMTKDYFELVLQHMMDHVPKMINQHLVIYALKGITEAANEIYLQAEARGELEELIQERRDVAEEREKALKKKQKIEKALDVFKTLQRMSLGRK